MWQISHVNKCILSRVLYPFIFIKMFPKYSSVKLKHKVIYHCHIVHIIAMEGIPRSYCMAMQYYFINCPYVTYFLTSAMEMIFNTCYRKAKQVFPVASTNIWWEICWTILMFNRFHFIYIQSSHQSYLSKNVSRSSNDYAIFRIAHKCAAVILSHKHNSVSS